MRSSTTRVRLAILGVVLGLGYPAWAAVPPELMNFQGVLRDASGNPVTGSYEMVFRLYSSAGTGCPAVGGTLLVTDQQLVASPGGAVNVSGGLFDTQLGRGTVLAGSEPNVGEAFRDNASVWVEIVVGAETLCPRIRVVSSGYSLNSSYVDGLDSTQLLRSDASDTFTSGTLSTSAGTTLDVNGTLNMDGAVTKGTTTLVANFNADLLDGVSAAGFLRADASNAFTSGTLTTNAGTTLDVNGTLSMDGAVTKATTTLVTNLNADLLDGLSAAAFAQTSGTNSWSGANTFTRTPVSSAVGGGPVYVNPASSPANGTLLGAAVGGVEKFRVDGDGDVTATSVWAHGYNLYGNGYINYLLDGNGDVVRHYFRTSGGFSTEDRTTGLGMDLDSTGKLTLDGSLEVEGPYILGDQGSSLSVVAYGALNVESWGSSSFMFDEDNSTASDVAAWYHDGSYIATEKLADLSEQGNFRIRGALSQFIAFDLAESFLASEPLEPGDLVRVDPARPDAVLRTTGTGDRGVLGVVSSKPGMLLGSAPFDAGALREVWGAAVHDGFQTARPSLVSRALAEHPDMARESEAIRSLEETKLAAGTEDEALLRRRAQHDSRIEELALEAFWKTRVAPIALAGRVPVKVTGPIEVGDALSPSSLPGVAKRAEVGDAVVAIALERLAEGKDRVLALVSRTEAPHRVDTAADARPDAAPEAAHGLSPTVVAADGALRESPPAHGPFRADASGVAEYFPVSEPTEPGDVLVIDPERPGFLMRASMASDPGVVGVVSAGAGVLLAAGADTPPAGDHVPVALSGTIVVKVDAGYGAIRPGDLLVTSPTEGHAMRAVEAIVGTIVGKALQGHEQGTGTIRALAMLR